MNRIADIATDIVAEAVNVTVLHVRRIVGALGTAVDRTKREVGDLAWDYGDLAASVRSSARRSRASARDDGQVTHGECGADVISIDRRRRKAN
ncbi:hypothetical protein A5730_13090 [Mycobacterium sp. ACS4054]|uniref:hypothetical protein n=1 Tax=Mycobacterium sp. ACS4054 TaxID=1834119 RepID=UPI0007FC872C|nr:hypothetical protein [Mycobacterium sp. ACS4054]OBF06711.1 hypothetical protein A5730_13090 [Mycobacterium sp. ACS4054]